MSAFLGLWLAGLFLVGALGVYNSLPPQGARPNVYELSLWVLSSTALALSAITFVVSIVLPQAVHPGYWLP